MALFPFNKSSIQKSNIPKVADTQSLLKFSEIRNDTLIMKDGSLRGVVKARWLNLDLKNEDEQSMVIEQYKRFLNGIDFPVQILVHNTYLDLTDYINYLKDHVKDLTNKTLQDYGTQYYRFLDDINMQEWLIYTKEFYIVVPYLSSEKDFNAIRRPWWQKFLDILDSGDSAEKIVSRYRQFLTNKKFLDTRLNLVLEWLKWLGMTCEIMEWNDIVKLLFKIYNPNLHKSQADFVKG